MRSVVNGVESRGKKAGIISNAYDWNATFKSLSYCSEVSNLPLIFSNAYCSNNFSDFKSFAGWSTPNIKECNPTVNCYQNLAFMYKP